MKKLFVSCPMKGRTEENIKKSIEKMHKIAEIIFDQELELIHSYEPTIGDWPEEDINNYSIYCLGESIKKMSKADFFIGIHEWSEEFKGCVIEREVARQYDIPLTLVSMRELMPDAVEVERINYSGCVTYAKCEPEASDNVKEE